MSSFSALGEIDLSLSQQLDAVWGNPDTWTAQGLHWTHLDQIRAAINLKVSGHSGISPLAWFFQSINVEHTLPLRRVLILGCGSGALDREIAANAWVEEIVSVDLSGKALEVAQQQASASGLNSIRYFQADMNHLPIGSPPFLQGSFDAVLGVSSIHHCENLESLYRHLGYLLAPNGWFFINEYVGPDQFQWPDSQIHYLNRLANLLPQDLMTTRDGKLKHNFRAPSVAEVIAVDPSEAICSSRILPLLHKYFSSVEVRPYGGGILHLLLAEVAQNFIGEQAGPYLRCLMSAEDELYREGKLNHDFACAIARFPTRL